jgi:hypothetical protein
MHLRPISLSTLIGLSLLFLGGYRAAGGSWWLCGGDVAVGVLLVSVEFPAALRRRRSLVEREIERRLLRHREPPQD